MLGHKRCNGLSWSAVVVGNVRTVKTWDGNSAQNLWKWLHLMHLLVDRWQRGSNSLNLAFSTKCIFYVSVVVRLTAATNRRGEKGRRFSLPRGRFFLRYCSGSLYSVQQQFIFSVVSIRWYHIFCQTGKNPLADAFIEVFYWTLSNY